MTAIDPHAACDICGHHGAAVIATGAAWESVVKAAGGGTLDVLAMARRMGWRADVEFRRCVGCGSVVIAPLPDAALLNRFYAAYHMSADYAEKGDKKIGRTARRLARLGMTGDGRRFLDVGCNLGFAVEAARRAGFDATGIDLDASAIARARQYFPDARFEVAEIGALADSGRRFDLVNCTEVLEHVREPAPFVAALARLTAPGGLLYLSTPDAGHIRVPRDFVSWSEVKPPEHLRWLTRRGLRRLLTAAGFAAPRFRLNVKPGIRLTARRIG